MEPKKDELLSGTYGSVFEYMLVAEGRDVRCVTHSIDTHGQF